MLRSDYLASHLNFIFFVSPLTTLKIKRTKCTRRGCWLRQSEGGEGIKTMKNVLLCSEKVP